MTSSVDIVIVGAGLVGTPLAKVLSGQGWSVALLDAGTGIADSATSKHDNADLAQRCTALSLGTCQWFESADLWKDIAIDASAIEQVHVSHKGYFGSTRISAHEMGTRAVGYVVNNQTLNQVLLQQLQLSEVKYITNARVTSVIYDKESVHVHYANKSLKAKLLLAADGVSSLVRECAGIDTRQVDYDQSAVLGMLELHGKHHQIAYERFTTSGPLALLPRKGAFMSFVDCMEPHEREPVSMMSSVDYLQRLQQRFGFRLGRFKAVGPRMVTPLVRIEACEQIAQRTVLLGNAMRLLHPVGGQGYNLAIRDVAALADMLQQRRCSDPGNAAMLSQFVDKRRQDQQQVVAFTDMLARGFRGKASLPAHVRALGLMSLDTVSPLRNRFARRTMGIS